MADDCIPCGAAEADSSAIQTLILKKTGYPTRKEAIAWMREKIEGGRAFTVAAIEETDTSYRFEQFPGDQCRTEPRTIQLSDDISALICTPPGGAREEHVRVLGETPGQFMARLANLQIPDLAASAQSLRFHSKRMNYHRLPHVGRGWTRGKAAEALRATEARMEMALTAAESTMNDSAIRPGSASVHPDPEGGIHAHNLLEDGTADLGGRHIHVFLWRGRLVMTERDGAHGHAPAEGERTAEDNSHVHHATVILDNSNPELATFEAATAHSHEKLTATTALDGLHQHTGKIGGVEILTLEPGEFVKLFPVIEEIQLSPELAARIGTRQIHTGRTDLQAFWAAGHGTQEVRELLAPFALDTAIAQEAVEEWEAGSKWITVEGFVIGLGNKAISLKDPPAQPIFILIGDDNTNTRVVLRKMQTTKEAARVAAMAAVTKQNNYLILAELAGTATEGQAEGREVFREIATYSLIPDDSTAIAAATEAIAEALESFTLSHCGRFVAGAAEAHEPRQWNVVVLQAGLSKNRNFWPTQTLDQIAVALEGAPLEAIQATPRGAHHPIKMTHLPVHARMNLGGHSITLNGVGQLKNLRYEPTAGGQEPTAEETELIAKVLGTTPEEVKAQSKGRIVGTAYLDNTDRGNALEEMLASALDRDSLGEYLGLSIDVDRAPAIPINIPGANPILLRTGVDGTGRAVVDFVSHPSAGGQILGRTAA